MYDCFTNLSSKHTLPGVAYCAGHLAQVASKHTLDDYRCAKRFLVHLCYTKEYVIKFQKLGHHIAYISMWMVTSPMNTVREALTAFLILLNGNIIHFSSKLEPFVNRHRLQHRGKICRFQLNLKELNGTSEFWTNRELILGCLLWQPSSDTDFPKSVFRWPGRKCRYLSQSSWKNQLIKEVLHRIMWRHTRITQTFLRSYRVVSIYTPSWRTTTQPQTTRS